MRIMVIDPEAATVDLLRRRLSGEGYAVDVAGSGKSALALAEQQHPDLIVLDMALPDCSGIEMIGRLRAVSNVPLIMLAARGEVDAKVQALDSGADDYLVKPFSPDELLARIRAVLRRRGTLEASPALVFGKLRLDPMAHQASYDGVPLELSGKEFNILELLVRNPRQVISRDTFYERIWGYNFGNESNMLEVYISYLRSKLEKAGARGLLQTVRGAGYVLRDASP